MVIYNRDEACATAKQEALSAVQKTKNKNSTRVQHTNINRTDAAQSKESQHIKYINVMHDSIKTTANETETICVKTE